MSKSLKLIVGLLLTFFLSSCGDDVLSGSFGLTPREYTNDSLFFNGNNYEHRISYKSTNELIYTHKGTYEIKKGDIFLHDFFLNEPEIVLKKNENFEILEYGACALPLKTKNGKDAIMVNGDLGIYYLKL